MDVRSYGDRSPGPVSRRDGYLPVYDDYELRFNRAVSPAAAQTGGRTGPATAPRPTSAAAGAGALNHRLTRKMSADSLVAYRTYQDGERAAADPITADALRAASRGAGSATSRTSAAAAKTASFNGNGGAGSATVYSTMTLSRAQQLAGRARTPAGTSSTPAGGAGGGGGGPATAAKLRSLQLARKPLQIQTESFRPCHYVIRRPEVRVVTQRR